MSPLNYVLIGIISILLLVIVAPMLVMWWRTRGLLRTANSRPVEDELIRRLETIDRSLREEFSRNREESASSAKAQREELGKSLEGVRAIVDLRLKQLQEDHSKQIDKTRATVDEKLQGTLERRLGESFKLVSDRPEPGNLVAGTAAQTEALSLGDRSLNPGFG